MSVKVGEVFIADENVFGTEVSSVKKVFYLGVTKFVGLAAKDQESAAKLESFMFYCLFAENNDLELSYAIEDERVVLINKIEGETFLVYEEDIAEGEEREMHIIEIIEGHFGGHGASEIELSPGEIKKQFMGEDKKKLYVLIGLIGVLLAGVFYVAVMDSEEPVPVQQAPMEEPPLSLTPEDEIEMKRLGTIALVEAVEKKLSEINNNPFDYEHKKIAGVTYAGLLPGGQEPGKYPDLNGVVQFSVETDYPAVGSEKSAAGIYVLSEMADISIKQGQVQANEKPKMTEECLSRLFSVNDQAFVPNKRDTATLTFSIEKGDLVSDLRKIAEIAKVCPIAIDNIAAEENSLAGQITAYGFNK